MCYPTPIVYLVNNKRKANYETAHQKNEICNSEITGDCTNKESKTPIS